jgi:hypothetical protein
MNIKKSESKCKICHEHTEFSKQKFSQTKFRANKNSSKGILKASGVSVPQVHGPALIEPSLLHLPKGFLPAVSSP